MSVRPRIRELPAYDFTPHPEGVKLDQNELPFDLPEPLRRELLARVEKAVFNRYPDLSASELRRALASRHDWPAEGIVVTPGSNVLIQCLVITAGLGQTVLTPSPTFAVYAMQAEMLDAELREVPLRPGFELPVADLLEQMESGRGIVFIPNPAAPTGNLHPREAMAQIVAAGGDRWTIVIDEAYGEFSGSDFSDLARRPGVVSLRTLSKAFGLAGARVGYALAQPELATEIRKTVLPFNVSTLQQAAALTVLDHLPIVQERAKSIAVEREALLKRLAEIPGVDPYPSVTNFVLARVGNAPRVYRQLLGQGVVVRRQSHPAISDCIRVTVGTSEENERLLTALARSLAEVEHG